MDREKKQIFSKPITDVIRARTSIRTYESGKLPQEVVEKLEEFISNLQGPFSPKSRFRIVDDQGITENSGGKVGTYGVIKNAPAYILGAVENGDNNLEQLGYTFEKLILYCASLGLGTCWLGGTFNRNGFENLINLGENEILPAVTPVGYPSSGINVMNFIFRAVANSSSRKPWEELFFEKDITTPLTKDKAEKYELALEMVRLAPSASNKQPWRIIKDDRGYSFYLKPTKGYDKATPYNIQRIDIGIAMCHFQMTLEEAGIMGKWISVPDINTQEDMKYIVTWVEE